MTKANLLDYITPLQLAYISAAHAAPSADNTQPISYRCCQNEINVGFDLERFPDSVLGAESHAFEITLGANLENGITFCRSNNIDYQFSLNADLPKAGVSYKMVLPESQKTNLNTPDSIRQRHTNRLPYRKQTIPNNVLHDLHECAEGSIGCTVYTSANDINKLADIIRKASEMRFLNKEVHEWLFDSLRYTEEDIASNDGLDVNTLGLPPGGVLLLKLISSWRRMQWLNKHLGMYKIMSKTEAKSFSAAAAIAVIHGGSPADDAVMAGRVMERFWLKANASGLAVHPYYVVSDQLLRIETNRIGDAPGLLVEELGNLVESSAIKGFPHMILRVGYPKKQVKRSRRLPLTRIVSTET